MPYQALRHLLYLGDEVCEELSHVFLLSCVQRLFVHRVGLTEGTRVVRLPLALLHMNTGEKIHITSHLQSPEGIT